MAAILHRDSDDPRECTRDTFCKSFAASAVKVLFELRKVPLTAGDRPKRVEGDLAVTELVRKLERNYTQFGCLLGPPRHRAVPREVGIRQRELAARRQTFEQRDCVARRPLRFGDPAGTPKELRKLAQRVAFPESVAHRPPALNCFFERGDSFVVLIGQEALLRAALEQIGPLGRR